jgi:hypothetical protein
MKDQKADVKKLIEGLNVSEEKKSGLLKKLETEGVSDGLMSEIKSYLNEMEDNVSAQVPEMQELEKAAAEFNTEMDAIEAETAKADKQMSEELDKLEMEQTRKALGSQ